MPKELEKAALFLRLGPLSTLIRHETVGFAFSCGQKILWKRSIVKNFHSFIYCEKDDITMITWFPCPCFTLHKSKMAAHCCVYKFGSGDVWKANFWCVFREIFKIEFLRRNMNTALVYNLFPSVSSLAIHEINEFQPFSLFNNVTQINYYYSRWLWFWIDRNLAKNIIVAWVIAVDSIKPWKRSFISTVRSTAFSCLTRNPWRRRSFEKTLLKPEEFETPLCVLVWTENSLKTELSKPMSFLQTLTSLKYDRLKLRFLKAFSSVVWTENIWPVFRVKPFSNSASFVSNWNCWRLFRRRKKKTNRFVSDITLGKLLMYCRTVIITQYFDLKLVVKE